MAAASGKEEEEGKCVCGDSGVRAGVFESK